MKFLYVKNMEVLPPDHGFALGGQDWIQLSDAHPGVPRSRRLFGRLILILVACLLAADGVLQLISPASLVDAMGHVGFPSDAGPKLAPLTIACAALLVLPRSATFGAMLTTAFLGGAVCAHVRVGEILSGPVAACVFLGLATWCGLMLADHRAYDLAFRPVRAHTGRDGGSPR